MRNGFLVGLGVLLSLPAVGRCQMSSPVPRAKFDPAITQFQFQEPPLAPTELPDQAPAPGRQQTIQVLPPAPTGPIAPTVPIAPIAPVVPADSGAPPTVDLAPTGRAPSRLWGNAEYLLWWTKAIPVPTPMVTAATNLADPTTGQLGSPSTAVLLGGQSYDTNTRMGGRFTLGAWLDPYQVVGVEGTYLFIAPQSSVHSVNSNGTPGSAAIGLPFFNVGPGVVVPFGEGFGPLSIPGFRAGSATLTLTNRLQSGEFNGSARLVNTDRLSVTGLAGFRYLNFDEDLNFGFNFLNSAAFVPPLATGFGFDRFNANNNFYGGQLGLRGEYRLGNFFINATGKCALGDVVQTASVSGNIGTAVPGVGFPFTFNSVGGFYAQPTNIGHHTHSAFGVLPEGVVNIGYEFRSRLRIYAGYSMLYINDVERPGTAIQHTINATGAAAFAGPGATLVGPGQPNYIFSRSDFWAQGVNFGLQFKY